jgi:hypothetical protein
VYFSKLPLVVAQWKATPELAVVFTTTVPFTNVAVSAPFASTSPTLNGSGTVYLTDNIGPGTTVADELARVTLSNLSPGTFSTPSITLFTGLTLAAGTYYLISASDTGEPGIGWMTTRNPGTETTSAGTSIGGDLFTTSGVIPAYPPASPDFASNGFHELLFEVTGDSQVSNIPEPETYAMLLAGLGLMGFAARRRKQKAA